MTEMKATHRTKPSREERAAAAAEKRRREEEEIHQLRKRQLEAAGVARRNAEESLVATQQRARCRKALADHLQAFYTEVDKLAKGNRQLEATNLFVEQANDIIRDAKTIVTGDAYLDRVKEFVPAGENPIYPDILVVAATVQAALRRAEPQLASDEKRHRAIYAKLAR